MSGQKPSYFHERLFDPPIQIKILEELCQTTGWHLEVLQPREGFLCRIWEGDTFINQQVNVCTLNSYAASQIARDKTYTYLILQKAGIRVPLGDYFFRSEFFLRPDYLVDYSVGKSEKEAIRFGIALGMGWTDEEAATYLDSKPDKQLRFNKDLIVKPNSLSQGKGVFRVSNPAELETAIYKVFQLPTATEYIVIVQEYVCGVEFRLIMLDGELVLCAEKDYSDDSKGVMKIKDIKVGEKYRELISKISQVMQLRYLGVDLRCASLEAPAHEAVILEVNGNPFLAYYYYLHGHQSKILGIYEKLFRKLFRELTRTI